ncbi:uncharacterized protein LOC128670147 [Plodia interpunctella]|uniref:uncharacterized protein LOC128670147 n=1 Tax=Plodia interpunctella TaxID=58824 RepID=UPI002367778B|nr:uncharacterized protein LOC128670147 [Plodia interpunctella]
MEHNNKIAEDNEKAEEFKFDFINIPWDDRTKYSKLAIIFVLGFICLGIAGCVLNNFVMHYKGFYKNANESNEIKCHLVKVEAHPFVARIHLISSQQLLCLGAVISASSVIANGVCVKSGPIRLGLGSPTNQLCKKGFSVDLVDPIRHDGAISNTLVILTTMEKMSACSTVIKIADIIDYKSKAYILGRPLLMERVSKTLSRQPATILRNDETVNVTLTSLKNMKKSSMICVKDLSNCPVRAGDLLIQKGSVVGLASTSIHRTDHSNIACFADLKIIHREFGSKR